MTSKDNSVFAILHVALSSIPDGKLFTCRVVDGLGSNLIIQFIDDSGISKGTSGHDFEVTSAGTIRVEVSLLDAMLHEIAGGRGLLGDLTSGRDVIGRDGVSQVQQAVGALDVLDWLRRGLS